MGLLVAWSATVVLAQGNPDKALPDFRLTAPNGQEVAAAAVSGDPHWLLLYVSPDSPSSRRLVTALKEWQSPQLVARTLLVVRGSLSEAGTWVKEAVPEELAGLRWMADARQEAWTTLELQGTPVLMGIDKGEIAWRLAGVLNKPGALESVVRTWVEAR